ncbi:hypothetical protein DR864_10420 [Runella rosea]|uniref:Uncharacterized protein n=1 Tax=Runella rosea TaxID=2259595 RepID=A0A344THK0_9BACT|nr:hypothetical protein [Runella rosea]AXE18121.1 hypothetical protein DR864_10420 [Runella rosea]
MKKLIHFLFFIIPTIGGISSTFAQVDSIRITHTQETGTLEKQRFIDQYDYVFMTKEPTKWMLKGYGNINNLLGSNIFQKGYVKRTVDFRLGVERKLSPSFSIEIDVARVSKVPLTEAGLIDYSYYYTSSGNRCWATSAELRWYYDMAKRIRKGKSSNNFSGNYLSLRYERLWQNENSVATGLSGTNGKWNTDYFGSYYHSQLSLNYGIQRRFFRYGLIDFSIALNRNTNQQIHRKLTFLDGDNSIKQPVDWSNIQESITSTPQHNWLITTNFKVGVALADFKKSSNIPACDVFQCFENENNLWKISWPRISLSTSLQALNGSVGYEQKIAKSAFSVNTYLNLFTLNNLQKNTQQYDPDTETYFTGNSQSLSLGAQLHIQPRWYFLMNRQVRAGKSGNNLSGLYAGVNNVFFGSYGFLENDRYKLAFDLTPMFVNTGLLMGYQRKLFKNGFIDLNITKGLLDREPYLLGPNNFIFDFKLGFAL